MMVKGWQSQDCHYEPEVFLTSMNLFFGTFLITMFLKNFRNANFFPNKVRALLSDFAVVIALVVMTGIDMGLSTQTPKLQVSFNPK